MKNLSDKQTPTTRAQNAEVDAIVIGAGFSGLYAAYRLREQGYTVRGFERGGGVGGTWYWNRYPGAGSDSESWVYSYTFSRELEQDWNWSTRFPRQPEILRYLEYVANRFDLDPLFDFNTGVTGACYDESSGRWIIDTEHGETVTAKFLISAVGCLSAAQVPEIPGLDSFAGKWYHTGQWPHEGVDFSGLRVGEFGTGCSGIQCVPEIAKQAKRLTVFQRTPQFSIPAGDYPLTDARRAQLKRDIRKIRESCVQSTVGHPYDIRDVGAFEVSDEERRRQYESDWAKGGFEWMFGSYNDLLFDKEANDTAAEFVRDKIRQTVKDPETAHKLIPTGYPIGTKRLPLDKGYFEAFNRDNVDLISLHEDPIEEIVPSGIRTRDKTIELDAIVFATGFDAMTGPLKQIGIRGRGGVKLVDKWADGPHTYLGLTMVGFPNLFMITGPQSPSVLGNMPTTIEQNVDWIIDCMQHIKSTGATTIEATAGAEQKWGEHVRELAEATLFTQTDSWYMGANIPGKPRVFMQYVGGFNTYRKLCADIAGKEYEGFEIS